MKRLTIDKDQHLYEWIVNISSSKDVFFNTPGYELEFKSGSLLKILGDKLSVEFSSQGVLENNPYTPPDNETQSKIKLFIGNLSNKVVEVKKKVEETIQNVTGEEEKKDIETTLTSDHDEQTEKTSLISQIDEETELLHSSQSEQVSDLQYDETSLKDAKKSISTKEEPSEKIVKNKETKKPRKNPISYIKGVTKTNRENILTAGFDTVDKISTATIAELTKIHGVGKATAKKMIASAIEIKNKE